LIYRYEEPTTHSRWDKPLFTVPWADSSPPIDEIWSAITGISIRKPQPPTLIAATATSKSPSDDPTNTPTAPSTIGNTNRTPRTTISRPKIKPHQATVIPAATDPTALYAIDKRTTTIISAIRAFTLENPSTSTADTQGTGITIRIPDVQTAVFIPPNAAAAAATDELAGAGGILALPRLQRLRRQWLGLNRAYIGQGVLAVDQVGEAFVRFLNAGFAGSEED
jgi:protein KTI12